MLSLKTHGLIDYVTGPLLILSPLLFGFVSIDAARNVFLVSGLGLTLYSLFTNYQYSAIRVIPLGAHMILDVAIGVLLVIAPWIFNYREMLTPTQEYVHYVMGLGVFWLVGATREKTEADKRAHHVHPFAVRV